MTDKKSKKENPSKKPAGKPRQKAGGQAPESFKNPFQAGKFLSKEYKITPRTFDTYVKKGKILPDLGEKGFSYKKLMTYAKLNLVRRDTRQTEKQENLAKQEKEVDIRLKEKKERLIDHELDVKLGKVIRKDDFYREMAARAAVLENDFKGMIQIRATELVKLVDGDRNKTGELTRELLIEFDRMLNEFASTKEFKVVFKDMDDGSGARA